MELLDNLATLSDRIEAYQSFSNYCKSGTGHKKTIREASKKLMSQLLDDLDTDFVLEGLELLGCFIQLSRIPISDLQKTVDILTSKLGNCTDKIICRKALWCLASLPISCDFSNKTLELIVKSSLQFLTEKNRVVSCSIMCEAYKALKNVSNSNPDLILPHLKEVLHFSLPYLFHDADRLRELALKFIYSYAEKISEAGYFGTALLEELKSKYIEKLDSLVSNKDPNAPKIWEFLIICAGNALHSNDQLPLVNQLLRVEELALKSSDLSIRLQAIHAWEKLINLFTSRDKAPSTPRIKLLVGPLKSGLTKSQEIGDAKLRLWWHLLARLKENAASKYSLVTYPFLVFCFGAPDSPSSTGALNAFPVLLKEAAEALVSALSTENVVDCGKFSRQYAILSAEVFASNCSQIRVFCERAVTHLNASDAKLMATLWGNFKSQCLVSKIVNSDAVNELKLLAKFLVNFGLSRHVPDLLEAVFGDLAALLSAEDLFDFQDEIVQLFGAEKVVEKLFVCWETIASDLIIKGSADTKQLKHEFLFDPIQLIHEKNEKYWEVWKGLFQIYLRKEEGLRKTLESLEKMKSPELVLDISEEIANYFADLLAKGKLETVNETLEMYVDLILVNDSCKPLVPELRELLQKAAGSSAIIERIVQRLPEPSPAVRGKKRHLESDSSDSEASKASVCEEKRPKKNLEEVLKADWKLTSSVVVVEPLILPHRHYPEDDNIPTEDVEEISEDDTKSTEDLKKISEEDTPEVAGSAALEVDEVSSNNTMKEQETSIPADLLTNTEDSASSNNESTHSTCVQIENPVRESPVPTAASTPGEILASRDQNVPAASDPCSESLSALKQSPRRNGKLPKQSSGKPVGLPKNRGAQILEMARKNLSQKKTSEPAVESSPRAKHIYSPLASPSSGILKRPGSTENSPSGSGSKNRRVSFRCPEISDQIEIASRREQSKPQRLSRRSLVYSNVTDDQQKLPDLNEDFELGRKSLESIIAEAIESSVSKIAESEAGQETEASTDHQKNDLEAMDTPEGPANANVPLEPGKDDQTSIEQLTENLEPLGTVPAVTETEEPIPASVEVPVVPVEEPNVSAVPELQGKVSEGPRESTEVADNLQDEKQDSDPGTVDQVMEEHGYSRPSEVLSYGTDVETEDTADTGLCTAVTETVNHSENQTEKSESCREDTMKTELCTAVSGTAGNSENQPGNSESHPRETSGSAEKSDVSSSCLAICERLRPEAEVELPAAEAVDFIPCDLPVDVAADKILELLSRHPKSRKILKRLVYKYLEDDN